MITLEATLRDVKVNPKMIRKQGNIPAVFYGPGHPSTPISVEKMKFSKTLQAAGESTVITLKTPTASIDTLIHDVELDPITGEPIHVDFYTVSKDHKVEVEVPIEFVGSAPAEKSGAVVLKVIHTLSVEALPAKLPQHITVDLGMLTEMGSHVTVGDLKLPDGVRIVASPDEIIVSASAQQEEEVASAPIDMAAIAVEKKGKKEEESAE